jgi:CBS domain containing-hemolysin-like protein
MVKLLIGLSLCAVLLFAVILFKSYKSIPAKELKRRARGGDDLADALYKVVAFERSLDIALWFFIGISAAVLFTFLANNLSTALSIIIICFLLWFGFLWIPSATTSSKFSRILAKYTAPALHWVIEAIYPLLSRLEIQINRHRPINVHTGMYSKEDLLDLFNQQKSQLDNRISKEDLQIAKNALNFGEKLVRDCMTPRRVIKTVSASESVGPVLMEELHKSGHSRFPVYEGNKDNFVGVLYMRDMLTARKGGNVASLMENRIYYVHDEDILSETLQVFIKTHHHMFLVVNNFEEVVGILTLEDIIEQIVGKPIIDEFDRYDDLRAVATKLAKKEHEQNHHPKKLASE